jgi:hypothetical protein
LKIKHFFAMLILIFSHHSAFAKFGPIIGFDVSFLPSIQNNGSWELGALYPFAGLQIGVLRLTAFCGASFSFVEWGSSSAGTSWDYSYIKWYGSYCYGGTIELIFDEFLLGCGYGYEYFEPKAWVFGDGYENNPLPLEEKNSYPFIRVTLGGIINNISVKLYYDYHFHDNGYKFGMLLGLVWPKSSPRYFPQPDPRPIPPPPSPKPYEPPEEPVNNGTIYYQYDGTGYVFLDENVFYLCSSGKPVGYVENGVIYSFGGSALGFYESRFIYTLNGNPVGATDSKSLGRDAANRRPVSKANKQDLPAKRPHVSVRKPRLKNAYIGGSLRDVF